MEYFWADSLAQEVLSRRSYRYTDRKMPAQKLRTVKTSASLSGVLHIGRLSDSIRGESVYKALVDSGAKARLIWVAEDMDPLRKVPEGVPESFIKYIGVPVTDVPDPGGCHSSYVEHHKQEYFKVFHDFVSPKVATYSMRDEYEKGVFRPYIRKLLENSETVREIQDKYRKAPLPESWIPWTPICGNCGKIMTTVPTGYSDGIVSYRCEDYHFEKNVAKGCGHKGENDPLKDRGKLMWKGEWAAQWARWKVSAEGAGKEYQVPGSAWWVNAEICERVLGFPMPVPIFYEYIMIEGKKMSASVGNVIYPREWKEVAQPELLRFLYNKRLMKTRTFSWSDLPTLYEEYTRNERIFYGKEDAKNEKESSHAKRLYELSQLRVSKKMPQQLPFRLCTMIVQVFGTGAEKAAGVLKRTGHLRGKFDEECLGLFLERAKRWVDSYAPEQYRIEIQENRKMKGITDRQKSYLSEFARGLRTRTEVRDLCRSVIGNWKLDADAFFADVYAVLFGKDHGPRLAEFIDVYGRDRVADLIDGALG